MAAEAKRGCGYREVGAMYLVGEGDGQPCCKLPLPLPRCPTCGRGIKQARGWTWVDGMELFAKPLVEQMFQIEVCTGCVLGKPYMLGPMGLIWIGKLFYPSVVDFQREAEEVGISRRINTVPRGFKLGETLVLLAHSEACYDGEEPAPGIFRAFKPTRIEMLVEQTQYTKLSVRDGLTKRGITAIVIPDGDPDHQPPRSQQAP